MNCEVCHLKELEVELFQVREVLRCILHTIFFHRALSLVRPKDVDSELFDITYVQSGDAEFEKNLEEKVDHFYSWLEKHPNKKGQVLLSFYEVKNKQASWFTDKVERLYWEQWYINVNVSRPKPRGGQPTPKTSQPQGEAHRVEPGSSIAALESSLREVLFQIVRFVDEKKDHIPPVPNLEGVSFPYEITIPSRSDTSSSFGVDMIKRLLRSGHPSMLS
ncbi:unnamed protein product [Spirodela intermedia]|uniref:Autophagy-related protein 101 n=2 Tax=Spirodela intermedia TaxID=51605 RepID=A0A7I8IYW9_SPIIN|nr:unnamed protein product [Spirodela intermedia]CAA6663077.1 unnamed protein product [Spirodela intermedia]CAA7399514.1 unnamed protein product [Spirodela intermedia]